MAAVSFQPTKPLYLEDDKLLQATGTVVQTGYSEVKKNRTYHWIQLDQSIFYPQGGGQLSDKGTLAGIPVEYVHRVECGKSRQFAILHCFSSPPVLEVGQVVDLAVEEPTRHLYTRWHTAAHVVGHAVENAWPHLKACGGQCFPGDAHMKFKVDPEKLDLKLEISEFDKACKEFCDAHPPLVYKTAEDGTRKLHIGDYEGVNCGGTHLQDLNDLGTITINPGKPNRKEKTLTIKYHLSP